MVVIFICLFDYFLMQRFVASQSLHNIKINAFAKNIGVLSKLKDDV
jgi:hypothetical protein